MKRWGNLWHKVVDFDNLLTAYQKAKKGKSHRDEVALFSLNLEKALFTLQMHLTQGVYRPSEYRLFTIYDRKPRLIAAAPFRDRVVHHAVMNIIEPLLDRRFIDDCYACRSGKGVHAAVDRYQYYAQRYTYVLKLDIQKYFPSIVHQQLKLMLRRRLKDVDLLLLLDRIIDSSPCYASELKKFTEKVDKDADNIRRGIPIGNLTSQFFANLYLDEFDHWLKETCKVKGYIRYVDDLFIFADNKNELWRRLGDTQNYLSTIGLLIHPAKIKLVPSRLKVDVLGYQLSPDRRWLRNDNGYRMRRKLLCMAQGFALGKLDWDDIHPSMRSWIGHAQHGETNGLRKAMFSPVQFKREQVNDPPCETGRFLEQQTEEYALGQPQQEYRDKP